MQTVIGRAEVVRPIDWASMEGRLERAGMDTVSTARAMRVADEPGYQAAGEFLRDIKTRERQVSDYWKPAKEKAKAAHQEIVDREKAMLTPLREAEEIVKDGMARYQRAEEAKRRALAEEARRRQREEADRLLAEAVMAEQSGDTLAADVGVAMAQMVEEMPVAPMGGAAKAAGIGLRSVWRARVIDEGAVPVMANGLCVRPVDASALNAIARMTKGTASIPGVEFYEESSVSARAR